jgi:prefoldin subunit 5
MTSAIDPAKPISGTPTTASVRGNFAAAKSEIEALQAAITTLEAGKQPLDATLTALAAAITAANKLIYATGADQFATTDLSSFARTILDDANAAAARATLGSTAVGDAVFIAASQAAARSALGLVIGADVQAQDAELAAIAGLASAADRLPYFTGSGAAALATFTAAARTLLAAADAAAQRGALGLGTIATQDANAVALTGGTINGPIVSKAGLSLGGWHPNRFHGGQTTAPNSTQTLALAANTLYVIPFAVGDTATFVRIGIDVTTADAGKIARLGIYGWVDGAPGARVLDAGAVSAGSTGIKEITINQALGAGMYGLALVTDGAPTIRANSVAPIATFATGTATPGIADYRMSRAFTYAALPDPWGTPSYGSGTVDIPAIYLRTGT